jgi:hypothetical protein
MTKKKLIEAIGEINRHSEWIEGWEKKMGVDICAHGQDMHFYYHRDFLEALELLGVTSTTTHTDEEGDVHYRAYYDGVELVSIDNGKDKE